MDPEEANRLRAEIESQLTGQKQMMMILGTSALLAAPSGDISAGANNSISILSQFCVFVEDLTQFCVFVEENLWNLILLLHVFFSQNSRVQLQCLLFPLRFPCVPSPYNISSGPNTKCVRVCVERALPLQKARS